MRRLLILALFAIAATTACDRIDKIVAPIITVPEPMSPLITVAAYSINSQKPLNNDTLFIGDTLQISVALDPCYNTITNFDIDVDRRYLKDSIFFVEDYINYCDTALCMPDSGKYVFKDMVPSLGVFVQRMQFIAIKSPKRDTSAIPISISLKTDVDSVENPVIKTFEIRIVKRPPVDYEKENIDDKIDRLIREEAARRAGK